MSRMGIGPVPARVMLVGEAFGEHEERVGQPFIGPSGYELNRMLQEASILRSECYVTNVVNERPPNNDIGAWIAKRVKDRTPHHVEHAGQWILPIIKDGISRLKREIELVSPNIIVPLGETAFWALTGVSGITKWRGSQLHYTGSLRLIKLIPTLHPASILYQWSNRAIVVRDLRRVAAEREPGEYRNLPQWKFQIRPSFPSAMSVLSSLQARLDAGERPWIEFDLETRAGHIACAGISWSHEDALCIPLMCQESKDGYWQPEEEAALVYALYRLLTHPNARVRGQNLLYDAQYTYRHWHFVPHVVQDTMISHHTLFPGLPKRLDYQASLYCDHYVYWKDDGKTWRKEVGEDQLWRYNCEDCVRTREVGEATLQSLKMGNLLEVEEAQQRLFWPVLRAMQRGILIDKKARSEMAGTLMEEMFKREAFFQNLLGYPLNPNSNPQMVRLFYEDFQLKPIMSRAKKGQPGHVTCDDEALNKIMQQEPLMIPLVRAIREYRSLGVFLSTFVNAPLDIDGRMRCSFNICGAETYRFSSSKNAFGSGANLQNIPKGGEEDGLTLPNIRTLFIPDPGFTFFDLDLDRADLQIVVWEANERELKDALHLGVDMHLLNAYTLHGKVPPPLEELVESHPKYAGHRSAHKKERQLAKSFIHGTNYGGGPRTMAIAAKITVAQAIQFQTRYFTRYPGIKRWHERIKAQLFSHHYVSNAFGYRRYYFDRIETLLPEALAWIPQSTVANYIDRIWQRVFDNHPEIEVLLQVHDSLAGQFPAHQTRECLAVLREEASRVIVPYTDPLTIPIGIKTSEVSWGDC